MPSLLQLALALAQQCWVAGERALDLGIVTCGNVDVPGTRQGQRASTRPGSRTVWGRSGSRAQSHVHPEAHAQGACRPGSPGRCHSGQWSLIPGHRLLRLPPLSVPPLKSGAKSDFRMHTKSSKKIKNTSCDSIG